MRSIPIITKIPRNNGKARTGQARCNFNPGLAPKSPVIKNFANPGGGMFLVSSEIIDQK